MGMIPFMSQLAVGSQRYNNDCGPACVAMILNSIGYRYTVDEVFEMITSTDRYTNYSELMALLEEHKFSYEFNRLDRTLAIGKVSRFLQSGLPSIVLIKYNPKLMDNPASSFEDMHFVIVHGQGRGFYIVHDPLNRDGGFKAIAKDDFQKMWATAQPSYSFLVISGFPNEVTDDELYLPGWYRITSNGGLYRRSAPSIGAGILELMPDGLTVEIVDIYIKGDEVWGKHEQGGWSAIEYQEYTLMKWQRPLE